jgi:hypothetical protein
MIKKRLLVLEEKLQREHETPIGYVFRVTDRFNTTTEHEQRIRGHRGQPVIIECDDDDWNL